MIGKRALLVGLSFLLISCGNDRGDSPGASSPDYPNEIGTFVQTENGWTRVKGYNYEGAFLGEYEGVRDLNVASLPSINGETRVYFNKVPMDPSQVYLGRNVNYGRNWKSKLDDLPLGVRPVGQDSYELTLPTLDPGVYNIYIKKGYSGLGHFVNVQ